MQARKFILTAKARPTAYDLGCPYCEESITTPSGSLFWTREEIIVHPVGQIRCECGEVVRLPKFKL